MKWITKKLTNLRRDKDFKLPLSALARAWDNGLKLLPGLSRHKPSRPYSQVELVWICVNLLIDICSSIQLMLSTDNDEIVESGPLYDFLFNNDQQSYSQFMSQTLGFYILFREVYWVYEDMDLQVPKRIRVVGPRQIEPVVQDGILMAYKLRSGNKTYMIDPEFVHPIHNFNPYDEHHGCGPLNAGDLTISSSYQAMQHIDSSLANGARLSVLLSTPPGVRIQEEEEKKLIAQFQAKQAGALNAGKAFLANGGLQVTTVNQTMAELQMSELSGMTDRKICALFSVPPECVGLNTEAQYAQGPATQRLVLYGCAPILSTIGEAIDDGIVERFRFRSTQNKSVPFIHSTKYFGSRVSLRAKEHFRATKRKALQSNKTIFAWFDVDSHPAVQEMLRSRSEHMLKFMEKGVPLNQIIRAGDLPFEEVPWGDHWWIGMGQIPAIWTLNAGPESIINPAYDPEDDPDEDAEDDKPEKQLALESPVEKAKKDRIWQNYVSSWHPLERQMLQQVRSLLIRQERQLVDKLKKAFNESKSLDRSKANENIVARVVFDLKEENGKLRAINRIFFERAAKLGAAQTISETTGAAGDKLTAAAESAIRQPSLRSALARSSANITSANQTTQRRVTRALTEGLENGEGLPELTARVRDAMKTSRATAQRVARTQVGSAVSGGRFAGLKAAAGKLKSWLTARDEEVRDAHRDAERKYASGIDVDQPFVINGESLMYPGDPSGSAANIINCRCLMLALYGSSGKRLDLDYYVAVKFVTEADLKAA